MTKSTEAAAARLPICDTLGSRFVAVASRSVRLIGDTLVANPGTRRSPWPRRGCSIEVVDSLGAGPTVTEELDHWFRAHGWRPALYGADSPDGTMFGLYRDPDLCIVYGRWNADSNDVALPGYVLSVRCVPAAPADTSEWITSPAKGSKPTFDRHDIRYRFQTAA